MKTRINRDDTYISPVLFLNLFNDTLKEIGGELLNSRKYKVLRESRIAALFSLALSIYEGGVWWLRPNPEDTAPDFYAFNTKARDEKGYAEAVNTEIEVFEWGQWSNNSLLEAIREKVHHWKAPNIIVVCYISKEQSLPNLPLIAKTLKKEKFDLLAIWIVTKIKPMNEHMAVAVYPDYLPLPIPSTVPSYFIEPYGFVRKTRGKIVKSGGKIGLDSEMNLKIYSD